MGCRCLAYKQPGRGFRLRLCCTTVPFHPFTSSGLVPPRTLPAAFPKSSSFISPTTLQASAEKRLLHLPLTILFSTGLTFPRPSLARHPGEFSPWKCRPAPCRPILSAQRQPRHLRSTPTAASLPTQTLPLLFPTPHDLQPPSFPASNHHVARSARHLQRTSKSVYQLGIEPSPYQQRRCNSSSVIRTLAREPLP